MLLSTVAAGYMTLSMSSNPVREDIETSAKYPFCYWFGSTQQGKPDGWGVGGCVFGREPPGKRTLAPPMTKPTREPCTENIRDDCECLFELHLIAAAAIDDYITFRGTYSAGQRNGEGTFFYSNGQIYRGAWKDDMRDGVGTLHGSSCEILYSGTWRADQPVGQPSS
jgi:hypothetical protein